MGGLFVRTFCRGRTLLRSIWGRAYKRSVQQTTIKCSLHGTIGSYGTTCTRRDKGSRPCEVRFNPWTAVRSQWIRCTTMSHLHVPCGTCRSFENPSSWTIRIARIEIDGRTRYQKSQKGLFQHSTDIQKRKWLEEIDRTRAAGISRHYTSVSTWQTQTKQRDPMESLLRRITKLKTPLQLSGHGVEKCCLDKQLLGDEAPALWHLVGHPPQATHLDRTI